MSFDQQELDAVAKAGQRYYDEHLKSVLEPGDYGRYVAIDPESGLYAVADSGVQAFDRVKEQGSNALLYLVRVGLPYAEELL